MLNFKKITQNIAGTKSDNYRIALSKYEFVCKMFDI